MKKWKQDDPFYDPYGAPEEKVFKVMIPLHKIWGFFKNRKKKKKTVRRNDNGK